MSTNADLIILLLETSNLLTWGGGVHAHLLYMSDYSVSHRFIHLFGTYADVDQRVTNAQ